MMDDNSVKLKDHFDQRFIDLEDKLEAIDRLNNTAIDKAVASMDTRLQSMNEFRAQMKDQQLTFATRTEFNLFMDKIDASIRPLELSKAMLEGKASQTGVIVAYIISAISLLIGIISLTLKFA